MLFIFDSSVFKQLAHLCQTPHMEPWNYFFVLSSLRWRPASWKQRWCCILRACIGRDIKKQKLQKGLECFQDVVNICSGSLFQPAMVQGKKDMWLHEVLLEGVDMVVWIWDCPTRLQTVLLSFIFSLSKTKNLPLLTHSTSITVNTWSLLVFFSSCSVYVCVCMHSN